MATQKIPIEISARHIHLSEADFEKLFGKKETLNPIKELSQPREFASDKLVTIVNENKSIKNVRILGPFRQNSQVEISLTDAYTLKLSPLPKIRVSGDLDNTFNIIAKNGKFEIKIPCIIAKRHIHLSESDAKKMKIKNNQEVSIKTNGERGLIFNNITARVSNNYKLAVHLDTDEGNSAGISGKAEGKIV